MGTHETSTTSTTHDTRHTRYERQTDKMTTKQTRNLLVLTGNAFKGLDKEPVKSRGDILYERNSARKQLREQKEERVVAEKKCEDEVEYMRTMLVGLIAESKDKAPVKERLWDFYVKHPESKSVFTKHTTGEKTHKGRAMVRGKDKVEVEEDAHLRPNGERYKSWKDGDEPCFFMEHYEVSKENFTLNDKGELVPIKKYVA